MSNFLSLLIASCIATQYFAMSWPAVFLVERIGRRKLLILGAAGQAATMAILAGVNSSSSQSAQIAAIVFLFVFNSFFALGWLGIPWLYPAEIVPLRIRAPANALSTSGMYNPVSETNQQFPPNIVFQPTGSSTSWSS
jgi:MFS family permease